MEKAVFTITVSNGLYNIKSKLYKMYNQTSISRDCVYTAMRQLTDLFKNVLKIDIVFEIG